MSGQATGRCIRSQSRAQAFLLEQAVRAGLPIPLERRHRIADVIDLQVIPRAIIRGGQHGLEIEGDARLGLSSRINIIPCETPPGARPWSRGNTSVLHIYLSMDDLY